LFVLFQANPAVAGAQYDKEFIVCSLDLLSGLAEGLGSGVESLVLIQNFYFWDMKHEFLFVQYISSSWICILPIIFLCVDKSLKWTAYLHFQNFPTPFDIFFLFVHWQVLEVSSDSMISWCCLNYYFAGFTMFFEGPTFALLYGWCSRCSTKCLCLTWRPCSSKFNVYLHTLYWSSHIHWRYLLNAYGP
jgi:hypothetical protein